MKLIDDYISDQKVRDSFRPAWDNLPEADTAWVSHYDAHFKPNNVWEKLASEIWGDHLSFTPLGYEYWGNTISQGQVLDWHKDKDEVAFEASPSKIICPTIGAIYYPFDDSFQGGFLEVTLKDDFDRIERFEAKGNRLIIFDPSSYHRVSRVYAGRRKAFVVNVWHTHLPAVANNVEPAPVPIVEPVSAPTPAMGKLYHNGL